MTRLLARLGLTEESFLLLPAVLIGVIAAAAAVAFHELIVFIRTVLYARWDPQFLYGPGIVLLIIWPALGGLAVGLLGRLFGNGGHGVPDVMESVLKTQGFMRPIAAVQQIITSSITIGTGGSAGAEGPIVQIGAAIASGVGRLFRIARQHMPILVGCGTAAGISAVFNAPIGGVLFTLEVILQEFSIRTFTPLVVASVVANVTTRAIYQSFLHHDYNAIFAMPPEVIRGFGAGGMLTWPQLPNFAVLGIACGLIAAGLTVGMIRLEKKAARWRLGRTYRPAIGGAALGVLGVVFVMLMGWWLIGKPKPFDFGSYPLPAFFSDGYAVIQELLREQFYTANDSAVVLVLLVVLCAMKLIGTCLTLATGGSGGVIAPSLFLGATTGAALGIGLRHLGVFDEIFPAVYALIGMGAVLGAVVHAPLASILILLELTNDYHIIMPAMLATITATGMARFIFPDSIYSVSLREHGIRVGSARELSLFRRMSVEQAGMEPAMIVSSDMPFLQMLEQMGEDVRDAVVVDEAGQYCGMVIRRDIEAALLQPDAIPLLLVAEVARTGVPLLSVDDDLTRAMEIFSEADVSTLAVCMPESPKKVVGVVTHQFLLRKYHQALEANR